MIYRLDKYQKEALDTIANAKVSIITGKKSSGKSFLLRYILNDRWGQGKSTLVIVPDTTQANIFQKHLGEFHLNKYTVILDKPGHLSQSNLIKIRAINKEEHINISKKDLQYSDLNFNNITSKLKHYYDTLNDKILFNKNFNQLIQINAFDINSFKNIYFNQIFETDGFEFNEQEYTLLQNNIKKAFELQIKGENKIDNFFLKKAYIEKTPDKIWGKISTWLKESRINILNVIQTIASLLQEQSMTQFNHEWEKISKIIDRIEHLLLEIDTFNIRFSDFDFERSNFLGLDKSLKEAKEKYSLSKQKIILDYKAILNDLYRFSSVKDGYIKFNLDEDNWDSIQKNLQKIISDLPLIEKLLKDAIRKELKSINFRNTKNEFLLNLQKDIEKLFLDLNNGYAVKKWEDNAFSIHKQLLYLEQILEDLNIIEGQKNNFFKNYNWNSFFHNLDSKPAYIIRKLNIYRPKNWVLFFKNYYIQNLILKNKRHFNIDASLLLNKLVEANSKREKLSELKSIKIWQNKRKLYVNKIKNEDEALFKSIFNQTNDEISLKSKDEVGLLSSFFPVIIIPEKVFTEIEDKSLFDSDMIIYENAENFKKDFNLSIVQKDKTKLVYTLDEEERLNEIKKSLLNNNIKENINTFELRGFHQQGMINLLDMNYSERLYAARNLAHLLQSSNKNIKIFQMKNTIIFSALDEILNKVLLKLLDKTGIKEMRIIDTPFHLLVDNLLEINKKQILITQNRLINHKTFDNILWQMAALEKITKGGVKIVNFNTSDLLETPIENIKSFVKNNLV